MRRPLALLAVVAALVLGAAACGTDTLSPRAVARGAEDALGKKVGQRPDVKCPDELEAVVGARTRCTLTAAGLDGTYGVTVTVTSVKGKAVNFDVHVDEQPQG